MKPAYFHLLSADNDDTALGEAKVLGYVPPTCLLGGAIVWKLIQAEVDPCTACNGPRAKCHGREKLYMPPQNAEIAAMLTGAGSLDPFRRFFTPGQ